MSVSGLPPTKSLSTCSKERTNWLRRIKRSIRHDLGPLWWIPLDPLLDEPLLNCYDLGLSNITPDDESWFRALKLTSLKKVKVVLLGEEPYYQPNYADGLAFSRKHGWDETSSVKNLFKELKGDLGHEPPNHGDLSEWARRGVLLLNCSLTCEIGKPGSGSKHKWNKVVDKIIDLVNNESEAVVWLLMGKEAQSYESKIRGHIIRTAHPSPNSAHRGFFFSKPFSSVNGLLETPIDWELKNR
jgi:uracil-DNA glycosylase